ncbi:hypothetical protein FB451DRAFT_1488298 [Mycena latifolia]|nr:hypothetical protein FB451DRAFT_1488298 [Mycena latifolia]
MLAYRTLDGGSTQKQVSAYCHSTAITYHTDARTFEHPRDLRTDQKLPNRGGLVTAYHHHLGGEKRKRAPRRKQAMRDATPLSPSYIPPLRPAPTPHRRALRQRRELPPKNRENDGDQTAQDADEADPPLQLDTQPAPIASPSTPPRKAAKRSHTDTQTREEIHSERPSPAQRYTGKQVLYGHSGPTPRSHAPLPTSPTKTRLETTTLVEYEDDDNDESPIENLEFFNTQPAAPQPSLFSAPSPPDSASAPSPSDSSFTPSPHPSDSDTTPSPSPSLSPSRSPSPAPTLKGDPPPPHDDDDPMDDGEPPAPYARKSHDAFLAQVPAFRDENPHHPSPAHDPASDVHLGNFATVQTPNPGWELPVIAVHVGTENMPDKQVEAAKAAPDKWGLLTGFCLGSELFKNYPNIRADYLKPLLEVAGPNTNVKLIQPDPKVPIKEVRRGKTVGKTDRFLPPIGMLVKCGDPEVLKGLIVQATFASTRTVAFHVTPFDICILSWAIGFFRTDIDDPPALTGRRLAHAMREGMEEFPDAISTFDRGTQGGSDLPRDQRFHAFADTFDVRYLPSDDVPVYVLFAKPCTSNPVVWDAIRAVMRKTPLMDDLETFKAWGNSHSGHNLCADCHLDTHPRYLCTFSALDPSFWGPLGLNTINAELRGESADDEDEGSRRSTPRARTGNASTSRFVPRTRR